MSDIAYSIVLPCYNEARNIPLLLERFKPFADSYNFELILVNNGSIDNTAAVIKEIINDPANLFIRVVTIPKNIGYGHGIHTGLKVARGDILAYSHADMQTLPEDIFKAFDLVNSGKIDLQTSLIKGYRINRSDGTTFLTKGLALIVKLLLGVRLEDINGQPKIFSRNFFNTLDRPPNDFSYDVYVLYRCALARIKVETFDVDFGERAFGESKWATTVFGKYRTVLKYLKSIAIMSWANRAQKTNPIGQIIRFLMTGILTNLVNYTSFILMLRIFGVLYWASSAIGFITGFLVGFIVNRNYTFGDSRGNPACQMVKFGITNAVSLGVNMAVIYAMVDLLDLAPEIGQIVAILASTIINFSGSKFWAFRPA